MTAVALDTAYLDTAAEELSFALDLPALPALATADVAAGGLTVRLRLLGASHQVIAGPVRETVACLARVSTTAGARTGEGHAPDLGADTPPGVPLGSDARAPVPSASARGARLPASLDRAFDGWLYSFRSRTVRLTAPGFRARLDQVRAGLDGRTDALYGVFPGDADAFTALRVDGGDAPAAVWSPPGRIPGAESVGIADGIGTGDGVATIRTGTPHVGPGHGPPAGRRQIGWRTWHSYPQHGAIVETRSRMVAR